MNEGLDPGWRPDPTELLGSGGEAEVYALGEDLVVRLYPDASESTADSATLRATLAEEIARAAHGVDFQTPVVVGQGEHLGRLYQIERRLTGESLITALGTSSGADRRTLITDYLETAWAVGDIVVSRDALGEIGRRDAITSPSWHEYLIARATNSLATSPIEHIDAADLVTPIDDLRGPPVLIHLDYFPGNVMATDGKVSAVIDFGYSTIIGDQRMSAVAAVAHLVSPRITPTVTADDVSIAHRWLTERGLADYYETCLPWLAAYWTFAWEDEPLLAWCRSILE